MIQIQLKTDGKEIADSYQEDQPTLNECALIIFRLEEIKQYLLSKEFESSFEVKEGDFIR